MWSWTWLISLGLLSGCQGLSQGNPTFCLSPCSLRACLSPWGLPGDPSSKVVRLPYLAAQSSPEHKSQGFLMRKPRTGTLPVSPHSTFQAQARLRRGDYASWIITSSVIECHNLLGPNCTLSPPHLCRALLIWPLCRQCFPSASSSHQFFG